MKHKVAVVRYKIASIRNTFAVMRNTLKLRYTIVWAQWDFLMFLKEFSDYMLTKAAYLIETYNIVITIFYFNIF